MEQLSVEVQFEGEQVGSHTDKDTAYTLYNVGGDLYMVHVDAGDEKLPIVVIATGPRPRTRGEAGGDHVGAQQSLWPHLGKARDDVAEH